MGVRGALSVLFGHAMMGEDQKPDPRVAEFKLLAETAMAIRFRPVGPLVEYHGPRQPCYCVIADVLNAVRRERPAFWSVLTDRRVLID